MMKQLLRVLSICLLLVSTYCGPIFAQSPQATPNKDALIRLPMSVVPVTPAAVTVLKDDSWFVIEAEVPCLVLASREGYVLITPEKPPIKLRGKFADGQGKVETRSYTAKNIWIVEAITTGEVELLIVPEGAKDSSAVIRRTLVVGSSPPNLTPNPGLPNTPKLLPEGVFDNLPTKVKTWVAEISDSKAMAGKLAAAYAETAKGTKVVSFNGSLIETLLYSDIESMLKIQTVKNREVLGADIEKWRPFFVSRLGPYLDEQTTKGKLVKLDDYKKLFAEISLGLEAAASEVK